MDDIDAVRDFNRFYLRELGLLQRNYLGSGLGVSEMRVLHELAHDPADATAIADRLGLDRGYLSRVLRGFEQRGWLVRSVAGGDGRRRDLEMTEEGRRAMAEFEGKSREAVARRIGHLPPPTREALRRGLAEVRRALGPNDEDAAIAFRAIGPGDGGWIVQRHGELYASDEGYDGRFEGLVAGIVAAFLAGHDPQREGGWIVLNAGRRMGSVFVVTEDDRTARLRLVLLEPTARGRGIGRRLVGHAMDFARGAGYGRMILSTHKSHSAACALYAALGFRMIEAREGEAFGQRVTDQIWARDL